MDDYDSYVKDISPKEMERLWLLMYQVSVRAVVRNKEDR